MSYLEKQLQIPKKRLEYSQRLRMLSLSKAEGSDFQTYIILRVGAFLIAF